jgi:transcriptional regulator with XRE-family HTH domain
LEFAAYLKSLRRAQALTQQDLAAQAGVSLRTLIYWERGDFEPREQDLAAVFRALNVRSEEQQRVYELLTSRCWKGGRKVIVPENRELLGAMPGNGDLIRALRLRHRFTRAQLAREVGVDSSSLSRWEQNETVPTEENLMRLCRLLEAQPEECAALLGRRLCHPGSDLGRLTHEECRQRLTDYEAALWTLPDPLHGLYGLALTGAAWRMAAQQQEAEPLLARAYCLYGAYLLMNGLQSEAAEYSEQGLRLLIGRSAPERFWLPALYAVCLQVESQARQTGTLRGVHYLNRLLPLFETPEMHTYLLLHVAEAGSRVRRHSLAQRHWKQAHATALTVNTQPEYYEQIVCRTQAHLLLAAGKPADALVALPEPQEDHAYYRITYRLTRAEALLRVGERSEAHTSLTLAYEDIARYDFSLFCPEASRLAERM